MLDREKIVRFYRASGDGELAARLCDLAEAAGKSRKYRVSDFLDPHGYAIAESIAAGAGGRLLLESDGGYPGAERIKAIFISDEYHGKTDSAITLVTAEWDARYYHITHRDVLGALMGAGVKREILGDIIMKGAGCQMLVDSSLASFLMGQLTTIGAAAVTTAVGDLSDIEPREEKVKEIRTTVASLRLDVIAAAGFGTSRSRMAGDIAADKLKVNWQSAKNSAQPVKAGDIISMRGRGRVEVCEVLGQTKKGRISVALKRFI